MTRMLTTGELSFMFSHDVADVATTERRLERVGLTLEQAVKMWQMFADNSGASMEDAGCIFMAALLVAETHATIVEFEVPSGEEKWDG